MRAQRPFQGLVHLPCLRRQCNNGQHTRQPIFGRSWTDVGCNCPAAVRPQQLAKSRPAHVEVQKAVSHTQGRGGSWGARSGTRPTWHRWFAHAWQLPTPCELVGWSTVEIDGGNVYQLTRSEELVADQSVVRPHSCTLAAEAFGTQLRALHARHRPQPHG